MTDRLETSVLIDRSPEEIYAFLSAAGNHAKFIPGMLEFRQTSPGSFGQPGATARGLRQFLGRRMELPYEIIEAVPNRKLGMKGVMGPIAFEDGYELEAQGSGTRVTFWLRFKPSGWVKLAMPVLIPWGRIHGAETVANLKRSLRPDA